MTAFFGKQTDNGSMTEKRTNPALTLERAKCTFDQKELTKIMVGGDDNVKYIEDFVAVMEKHPELGFTHDYLDMTRAE